MLLKASLGLPRVHGQPCRAHWALQPTAGDLTQSHLTRHAALPRAAAGSTAGARAAVGSPAPAAAHEAGVAGSPLEADMQGTQGSLETLPASVASVAALGAARGARPVAARAVGSPMGLALTQSRWASLVCARPSDLCWRSLRLTPCCTGQLCRQPHVRPSRCLTAARLLPPMVQSGRNTRRAE